MGGEAPQSHFNSRLPRSEARRRAGGGAAPGAERGSEGPAAVVAPAPARAPSRAAGTAPPGSRVGCRDRSGFILYIYLFLPQK